MRERRVLLAIMLVATAGIGAWALLAPASFYTNFPLDRSWVALDGPYNEHLLRDVGALNLALALVVGWALGTPSVERVRLAAAAMLTYAVPHLVYHASHLAPFGFFDAVAQTTTLTLTMVAPVWLLWRARGRDARHQEGVR